MNRGELRQLTLELLADPAGGYFTPERVNLFLKLAFDDLVTDLDGTVNGWGVAATPITVSVVSGTREYPLIPIGGVAADVRKVMDVVRLEGTWRRPAAIIPFQLRNDVGSGPYTGWPFTGQSEVYLYQDDGGGWRLGTVEQEPQAQTLEAYYQPKVPALGNDGDTPGIIPAEYQSILAYLAGISLKGIEKRDATELLGMYQKKLARLRSYLHRQTRPGTAKAI